MSIAHVIEAWHVADCDIREADHWHSSDGVNNGFDTVLRKQRDRKEGIPHSDAKAEIMDGGWGIFWG